jgi:hypothetical protein
MYEWQYVPEAWLTETSVVEHTDAEDLTFVGLLQLLWGWVRSCFKRKG